MNPLLQMLIIAVLLSAGCKDRAAGVATPNLTHPETSSINSELISSGTSLKSALAILDSAGYTNETAWQWGSIDPDAQYICRVITDGIYIVLYYSEKSQVLTGIAMMYVPPDYTHRGNYQVVSADTVAFNSNGTYTVVFQKPLPTADK